MPIKLAMLEQFRAACAVANTNGAVRLLDFHPEIAHYHVKDGRGHFVTALDIAMSAGKPYLVDRLLESGARMDLPVGEPPSATHIGHTSMTRALDRKFAKTPNHAQILQSLIWHHGQREIVREAAPVLSALKSLSDNLMRRIATTVRDAIAGDTGKLTAAIIPASAIGVTSGAMMQDLISQPQQAAAIAASALASAGIMLLKDYAKADQHHDRLRTHQMQAVDAFDRQAGIAPKVREFRLPPLTNNVLDLVNHPDNDEENTSGMSMGR